MATQRAVAFFPKWWVLERKWGIVFELASLQGWVTSKQLWRHDRLLLFLFLLLSLCVKGNPVQILNDAVVVCQVFKWCFFSKIRPIFFCPALANGSSKAIPANVVHEAHDIGLRCSQISKNSYINLAAIELNLHSWQLKATFCDEQVSNGGTR